MAKMSCDEKQKLFTGYYAQYYHEFYRYAFYFMGNAEDAEDAVADALASAYDAFDSLRETEKFKFWFLKILQNQCKGRLKKRTSSLSIESEYENGLEIADDRQDPELSVLVRQLLAGLKPADRSIVLMSVLGGYSSAEIASAVGLSAANVRVRLHRVLGEMRQCLRTDIQESVTK